MEARQLDGPQVQTKPFTLVGGNTFGRSSKISRAETFNFIVSDGWFVPFAGYNNVLPILTGSKGRDIYSSSRGNIMLTVVGNAIYSITASAMGTVSKQFIGNTATAAGDIFISENNLGQIAITDGVSIYVYTYSIPNVTNTPGFVTITPTDFAPGYITFQNGRFIVSALDSNTWRLSTLTPIATPADFPFDAQHVGTLQTKPDSVIATIRFPGRGNLLFVFGSTVTEPYNDVGGAIFPYVRLDSFNMDYGLLSANTLAENETIVVGLFANEQSGPAIMFSTGSDVKKISTDGIDYLLSRLTAPQDSYGFLFRQDGHQIYQITFVTDNLSLIYDFNTNLFFTVTDEYLNYHIAKRVVFFNNKYYFVSFNDGNLYEFGTQFTTFQYAFNNIKQIPRIRICSPERVPSSDSYIARSLSFIIENGGKNEITYTTVYNTPFEGNPITTQAGRVLTTQSGKRICTQRNFNVTIIEDASEAVDLSVSRDGGVSFGSSARQNMNPTGKRKSKFQYQRLGWVNDATYQLRFWGFGQFIVGDGELELYK